MCKILIVDDDKELCKLIRRSVIHENIEAEYCYSGLFAIKKIKEEKYELVILDVMMPDMDGFETLERIRETSDVPILMLTAKNNTKSKVIGLKSGADDYLTKPFDMDELIARVVSLLRRYSHFYSTVIGKSELKFKGLVIDTNNRTVKTELGTFELPPKEYDVLIYLIRNQGKILTKQMIYEEVWDEDYIYDDSNIMAIISRIRKKIEKDTSLPVYIQTVKGVGYRFNGEV
ncbi:MULTISPECIES: response regulator transcription factor [Peptoniphilaceae]|uniref:response regulator transcription factor n=1 Tax=Peptoniphilaceae TaxID=1570339 RepID=UPI00257C7838|nr:MULTISPECIES: response regulator transcription factor [Peptoniphilaceae]MBS5967321.1 response regulator transcription factor [Finegoldia magna]MBS6106857.1 response regulator transcription factor [Anaerococcus sp.]